MTGLSGTNGFLSGTEDFLRIGNASTAEFLYDERHAVIITECKRYESRERNNVECWISS